MYTYCIHILYIYAEKTFLMCKHNYYTSRAGVLGEIWIKEERLKGNVYI